MSLTHNTTFQLWNRFMPLRPTIADHIGKELYSIELYPNGYYERFHPENEFEKWAAVEVSTFQHTPAEMETLQIPVGLYAVFMHRGPASEGPTTYRKIFTEWLPASDYLLDSRPHFAVMGRKYKPDAADSEEELWIPVREKWCVAM